MTKEQSKTPGPWELGEYDAYLGYDCMTGGVRAGPVYLDGNLYGQPPCADILPDQLNAMMADARLIAESPAMAALLERLLTAADPVDVLGCMKEARALLARIRAQS